MQSGSFCPGFFSTGWLTGGGCVTFIVMLSLVAPGKASLSSLLPRLARARRVILGVDSRGPRQDGPFCHGRPLSRRAAAGLEKKTKGREPLPPPPVVQRRGVVLTWCRQLPQIQSGEPRSSIWRPSARGRSGGGGIVFSERAIPDFGDLALPPVTDLSRRHCLRRHWRPLWTYPAGEPSTP